MPPKGRTKGKQSRYNGLSMLHSNIKVLSSLELNLLDQKHTIEDRQKELNQVGIQIAEIKKNIKNKENSLNHNSNLAIAVRAVPNQDQSNRHNTSAFTVSSTTAKKRKLNPTAKDIGLRAKVTRCKETLDAATVIHGASIENPNPALDGLYETLTSKFSTAKVTDKILNGKKSVSTAVKQAAMKDWCKGYAKSEENLLRSLNVFYSHNVMGKTKYIQMRKANKKSLFENSSVVNYVPYGLLSTTINNIDIGTVHDISPSLTYNLDIEEIRQGCYRSVAEYIIRLAKFYLFVNSYRNDKLNSLSKLSRHEQNNFVFGIAVGGDGAPGCGTSFLVSFINVGKRISSSSENFLIFGADVDESSIIVRRFVALLLDDLKFLESKVFELQVRGMSMKVEFRVTEIPNDMKMLAFLCGELSNAAHYFSSFANVNQDDANTFKYTFGSETHNKWKPFNYSKRISDVAAKKKETFKNKSDEIKKRTKITSYISKTLNSRQEEAPLLEKFIDQAKAEPLHIKNNTIKATFMKVFKIAVAESNVGKIKAFKDIPENVLFIKFVNFIRTNMNCNFLAKKIKRWFNDNGTHDEKDFSFRFRGKESLGYMKHFPGLILLVIEGVVNPKVIQKLHIIHLESISIRKVISLTVRIESFSTDYLQTLSEECRFLFKLSCLYYPKISPSLWTLCNCVPVHAAMTLERYGFGLGINTMEGREQKHQAIMKYAQNTTQQCRWPRIFRHEYIQLIYLRERGYDIVKYRKRGVNYIPSCGSNSCLKCCLKFSPQQTFCKLCDSVAMSKILADVNNYNG